MRNFLLSMVIILTLGGTAHYITKNEELRVKRPRNIETKHELEGFTPYSIPEGLLNGDGTVNREVYNEFLGNIRNGIYRGDGTLDVAKNFPLTYITENGQRETIIYGTVIKLTRNGSLVIPLDEGLLYLPNIS